MITALESLPTTIAHLRTIATPVVDHRIMPFGIPVLDDRLASRGLRAGALHEVAAQSCSMVDDAAATLFLTGIAAREAAHTGRPVLWVSCRNDLYAPGLEQAGLAPADLIHAQPRDDAALLAVVEDAVRDGTPSAVIAEVTVASPAYLANFGTPGSPDSLDGHVMVGFVSSRTGQPLPLEFTRDGKVVEVALPARVLVSGAETSAEAARLGLGLVQAPRYRFADDLASGRLLEVLVDFPPTPTPVSVLYPSSRQQSPRVRVFIDWLVETVSPQLAPA